MLTITLTKGCPASGKSTWARQEIAKDPQNHLRVNKDELRSMCNGSEYSSSYEKMISEFQRSMIIEGLKRDKNVILDNVNSNNKHFEEACELAKLSGKDVKVIEKIFFVPLNELIERDSKREGIARVGEKIIKKFFKDLGGDEFKNYIPRELTITGKPRDKEWKPLEQDETLPKSLICDLDGTYVVIGSRNPFNAQNCDLIDLPNQPTIDTVNLYFKDGYKIIFCSGRERKYEPETRRQIEKYLPDLKYELFMRPTSDFRKDFVIKEEIFNAYIKDKYFVKLVLDDRSSVVNLWRSLGLTCWQVAEGNF